MEDRNSNVPSLIVALDNDFPDKLNFFCPVVNNLQRDRFCYDNYDAYSIACVIDLQPLQLVPFCLGYKHQCSKLTFPNDLWCPREYRRYRTFCTKCKKYQCDKLSTLLKLDLSCSCEPYSCHQNRMGTRVALWCQRYELFCNKKKRLEESERLFSLLPGAGHVHQECLRFLNIADTLCNPFKPDFSHGRCIKFLVDCELIYNFPITTTIAKVTSHQ
ncbi:unnamed protein product [Thelazia callipaeda]|uniref:CXXC-type zinc finger protein 1 n=1 Tax=Thelazia callipaeda TaxID=103827 RepID=A0A0N5D4W5_THECL|nr:unnamed protein product [Thelazia callipaeda]